MPRISVSSSNLRSIGYDGWTGYLEVEFRGGRVYGHYGVPEGLYEGLMEAESKGRFYRCYLRCRYGCRRIY